MEVVVWAWLNAILLLDTLYEIVRAEYFVKFSPDFWRAIADLKCPSVWVWSKRLALLFVADLFNLAEQLNQFFHSEVFGFYLLALDLIEHNNLLL